MLYSGNTADTSPRVFLQLLVSVNDSIFHHSFQVSDYLIVKKEALYWIINLVEF